MYVTTFYSYKGGVGRTMALVNVATLLRRAGKRVLVVDFDLEAPGLPSFGLLNCARGTKGLVDYVETYRETLVAPPVAEFIVKCPSEDGAIWLMPAGDNFAPGYTDRLNAINWDDLYARQSGYLMFEDLKQQWAAFDGLGFDYVLVDSRTGHTDVGGICTRQLPDAVVIMFVPNNQNVDGLVPIVEGIRSESERRGTLIDLHFCPSNVPDEFDEADILERLLAEAESKLGFGETIDLQPLTTIVHHRTGLEILDQPIVTLTAPKSQLAREYETLAISIRGQNTADRDGALATLQRLPDLHAQARATGRSGALVKISGRADEIRREHPDDGEIALNAAAVFDLTGDVEEELASLSTAVATGFMTPRARLLRAIALFKVDRRDDALVDVFAVIGDPEGTDFEFRPAVQLLRAVAPERYLDEVRRLLLDRTTRLAAKLQLAPLLMSSREHLDMVADEMVRLSSSEAVSEKRRADPLNAAELALIGAGRFAEAIAIARREHGLDHGNDAAIFNEAMAQWGLEGSPPQSFIGDNGDRILRIPDGDANLHQCKAMVLALRGEVAAAVSQLQEASERVLKGSHIFSCWTYLYRSSDKLLEDIESMSADIESGGDIVPPFIGEARRSPAKIGS